MLAEKYGYRRRRYTSFKQFRADFGYLLKNRQRLRRALGGSEISPAFRQRLMLTVTAVNHCRYCAAYHAREALLVGLSPEETRHLLEGAVRDCPSEEIPALLYAQHWAETNARPEAPEYEQLIAHYGAEKAGLVELVLRAIRVGNLSGNTFDYLLCLLTRGRRGCGNRA
jgi:AhpD family alkylhydroperoxidase